LAVVQQDAEAFDNGDRALPGDGKKLGGHPFGLVRFDPRQSSQVDRVELHGANINKVEVEIACNLRDYLRPADAACAQMCRGTRSPNSA
jgi:hypothetical protein